MLWQHFDLIRNGAPSTAEFQHARQHANVHIDGPVGDSFRVTSPLKLGNSRRRDRRNPYITKVTLDDAETFLFQFEGAV